MRPFGSSSLFAHRHMQTERSILRTEFIFNPLIFVSQTKNRKFFACGFWNRKPFKNPLTGSAIIMRLTIFMTSPWFGNRDGSYMVSRSRIFHRMLWILSLLSILKRAQLMRKMQGSIRLGSLWNF